MAWAEEEKTYLTASTIRELDKKKASNSSEEDGAEDRYLKSYLLERGHVTEHAGELYSDLEALAWEHVSHPEKRYQEAGALLLLRLGRWRRDAGLFEQGGRALHAAVSEFRKLGQIENLAESLSDLVTHRLHYSANPSAAFEPLQELGFLDG